MRSDMASAAPNAQHDPEAAIKSLVDYETIQDRIGVPQSDWSRMVEIEEHFGHFWRASKLKCCAIY